MADRPQAAHRRRGAGETRLLFEGCGDLPARVQLRYRLRDRATALPLRVHDLRRAVQEERRLAQVDDNEPFARTFPPDPPSATPATDVLHGRLEGAVTAVVEVPLTSADQGSGTPRRRPSSGDWRSGSGFATRCRRCSATGLGSVTPADIQAYSRTWWWRRSRSRVSPLGRGLGGLDFGCSSGQVVRVLAAQRTRRWSRTGATRRREAIEWAGANLPGIDFKRSNDHPPLPYEDRSLDLVYATLGLDGRRRGRRGRLARRDGARPSSRRPAGPHDTRRPQSIAHAAANGCGQAPSSRRSSTPCTAAASGASTEGATTFFTPQWLWRRAGAAWRVSAYHPGRALDDHDLYVLEPR